jgi:diphthine-ammonia ligase
MGTDELDSFMFQTVGHTVLQSYAQCMGLPLFRHTIRYATRYSTRSPRHYDPHPLLSSARGRGKALNQDLHYAKTQEDEVESLYVLLKEVKKR